jgi:hypothetical protein
MEDQECQECGMKIPVGLGNYQTMFLGVREEVIWDCDNCGNRNVVDPEDVDGDLRIIETLNEKAVVVFPVVQKSIDVGRSKRRLDEE